MNAEWQKKGGVQECEGTDGTVGVADSDGDVYVFGASGKFWGVKEKGRFEQEHCQPRHRLIECEDGAVMVLSTDEVDGKPSRGAMVNEVGDLWFVDRYDKASRSYCTKAEAIDAAVAYVTPR